MTGKLPYELTDAALLDFEDIYDYTKSELGQRQAEKYLIEFKETLILLSDNPELGRLRTEIRKSLRSIPKGKHVIFYRIVKKKVRILRILHGSRDLPKQF